MKSSETLAETMVITRNLPRPTGRDPRSISRRLVAVVAAAATALGLLASTAIPARADSDDLAKALAALAIVGIIANESKKSRERERARAQQHYNPPPQYHPQPTRQPRVPSVCAIEISGNSGTAIVYGERCLRDEGFNFRLPQYCARTARIYGQNDRIYSDQCLRDAGFRVAGSRY
jgi:hypothetical protein